MKLWISQTSEVCKCGNNRLECMLAMDTTHIELSHNLHDNVTFYMYGYNFVTVSERCSVVQWRVICPSRPAAELLSGWLCGRPQTTNKQAASNNPTNTEKDKKTAFYIAEGKIGEHIAIHSIEYSGKKN